MNSGSDYSAFFSKGVSKELRQQALRHLFSHAKFNIRDGLNDYDEDYTTFEPLGDTVTSDMRWHKARKEREEKERLEAEALAERQKELEKQQSEDALPENAAENTSANEAEDSDEKSVEADQGDALQEANEESQEESLETEQDNARRSEDEVASSLSESESGNEQVASAKNNVSGGHATDDKIASMHDVVEGT